MILLEIQVEALGTVPNMFDNYYLFLWLWTVAQYLQVFPARSTSTVIGMKQIWAEEKRRKENVDHANKIIKQVEDNDPKITELDLKNRNMSDRFVCSFTF